MLRSKGLALYAVAVVVIFAACYLFPVSNGILLAKLSVIDAHVRDKFVAAAIIFFFVSATLAYFAFPSMPLIYVAAGYCLDPLYGGGAVLFGSAFGGLGAFLLYRQHIPHRYRLSPKDQSSLKLWLALLGLRLSPVVPAPLVNFFAAFFNASSAQYMTTTIFGSAPLILFYALLGQQGHNYINGERIQWWFFSGYLAILAVSTLLSSLGPWRSFLKAIKQLKNEVFTSIGQSPAVNCSPSNVAGQVGD